MKTEMKKVLKEIEHLRAENEIWRKRVERLQQPAVSEEEIIHIMRIGLEYITDADGMGRFFGEIETAKAILELFQSLNVQEKAQQRYDRAVKLLSSKRYPLLGMTEVLQIAAGLKEGGE